MGSAEPKIRLICSLVNLPPIGHVAMLYFRMIELDNPLLSFTVSLSSFIFVTTATL